jgi:hypothetical protein
MRRCRDTRLAREERQALRDDLRQAMIEAALGALPGSPPVTLWDAFRAIVRDGTIEHPALRGSSDLGAAERP